MPLRNCARACNSCQPSIVSSHRVLAPSNWRRLKDKALQCPPGKQAHGLRWTSVSSLGWQKSDSSSSVDRPLRTCVVTELVILLQVKHGLNQEEGEAILDALWSLQYLAQEGVVCAFAGQVLPSSSLQATSLQQQHPFTHAVHFRFSTPAGAERFQRHQEFLKMKNGKLEACCQQHCTLQFDVALHNELELIFRRGSEWEAGIEHLLILDGSEGRKDDKGPESCLQLSELANSPLSGALQSSAAQSVAQDGLPGPTSTPPDNLHVVMSRFERQAQLKAFLQLPPCRRLLEGGPALPVRLLSSVAFSVAKPQTKVMSPESSRLT